MTTQPEALRLADDLAKYLGGNTATQAADELRRLAAENEAFGIHLSERMKDLFKIEAQRDALLEALRPFAAINASIGFTYKDVDRARAAIKAVEGEQK